MRLKIILLTASLGLAALISCGGGGSSGSALTPLNPNPPISWSEVTGGTSMQFYGSGLQMGYGEFITLGCDSADSLGGKPTVTSTADGSTWTTTQVNLPFTNISFTSLAFGNGTFVAVGIEAILAYSTDGSSWNPVTAGIGTELISSVAFGDGIFVATLPGTTNNQYMTSTDGQTWSSLKNVSQTVSANIPTVFFANGKFIITSGETAYVSTDDTSTWNPEIIITPQGTLSASLSGLAYGGGHYVIGTNSGYIATSNDFDTWTVTSNQSGTPIYTLAYINGVFVASSGPKILWSVDGTTWSSATVGNPGDFYRGFAYGNGMYLGIGSTSGQGSPQTGFTVKGM